MQKLTIVLLVLCCISCGDNIEEFVPNDISIVYGQLQNIGPSTSFSYKLNNSNVANLDTEKNLELEIEANTFFSSNESNDIPYQLDIIGLNSYFDYITSNITHKSNDGIRDNVISFFVSAKDSENQRLSVKENKSITIRVPSERLMGNIQLGSGYANENSIAWDYSKYYEIAYTEWLKVDQDGGTENISGYEFSIDETGWYTLSVINDIPIKLVDVCMNLDSDKFDETNTIIFTLMESHQYLLQAQSISSNRYCNYNLPVSGSHIKVIAISYIQEEDQYYYASETIATNSIESTIDLTPLELEENSLILELRSL